VKLLEVNHYRASPTAEASQVAAFRALIDRDKSPDKDKACKELAFVWMVCDWESPLVRQIADPDLLLESAAEEVFGDGTKWKPDAKVRAAIDKYNTLSEHPIVSVLKAGYQTLAKYKEYLLSIDFTLRNDRNVMVHDPKKVMDTLNNMGKTVQSLDEIEENVKRKQAGDSGIRGGFTPNEFSE
jgi:hypothetical protein